MNWETKRGLLPETKRLVLGSAWGRAGVWDSACGDKKENLEAFEQNSRLKPTGAEAEAEATSVTALDIAGSLIAIAIDSIDWSERIDSSSSDLRKKGFNLKKLKP